MEVLKYQVEDRTIAELLGVQNFSNKESAVLELVKNGYDSGSKKFEIYFEKDTIIIRDYGKGMDKNDIVNHWMHVGKSKKGYEINLSNGEKRILSGSKGVGRFALARLGDNVELISKKENEKCIIWKTNWENAYIEVNDSNNIIDKGTLIKINGLRDKWSEASVKKLGNYLSRTYNDSSMDISLNYHNKSLIEVSPFYNNIKIGINCVELINLTYDSKKMILKCKVENDEFLAEAQKWCNNSIYNYTKSVNVYNLLENEDFNNDYDNLESILKNLGDFSAELYFSLKGSSKTDNEKFLYKHEILDDRIDSGVILYRNAFSISSFEGKKDWLQFGKRSRKSPAAATHPTGSWRVRENQISGKVMIDKVSNEHLKDMANRQGIEENVYYEAFIYIIQIGIGIFESYRQSLIRDINKKNKIDISEKKTSIVSRIVESPEAIKELTQSDTKQFVEEIVNMQKKESDYQNIINTNEVRYKYDIRILNMLSTLGLKAMSISHELRNDRNKMRHLIENIIESLKIYKLWDKLNEPEYTRYSDRNIPELLESNEKINRKILTFMDTMLEESEKSKFIPHELKIIELMENIRDIWEYDYSWVNINLDIDENLKLDMSEDIVYVIFDNLILNSIQQNSERQNLGITITIFYQDNFLNVIYRDNGIGLSKKYQENPFKILEVHETSRKNGHGLGMWIVNNTLDFTGGKVIEIKNNNGFYMKFLIGGLENGKY
jgi:signal transduction histidine kinase